MNDKDNLFGEHIQVNITFLLISDYTYILYTSDYSGFSNIG